MENIRKYTRLIVMVLSVCYNVVKIGAGKKQDITTNFRRIIYVKP